MRKEGFINTSRPEDSAPIVAARPNRYNELANLVLPERSIEPRQLPAHQVVMDIDHPARQGVIVHTSATDRAKGFQWMIAPISFVVALLALIVSLFFDNELFSLISLLVFWASFCLVYVIGWLLTAILSAEFVSLFSAKRQWDVIDREQVERWAHYRGQPVTRPWWVEYKGLITVGVLLTILLWAALVVFAMVMWG